MATLESLIAEYGKFVDKELIASIWAEQSSDEAKCRNIIRMLSGQGDGSKSEHSAAPSDTASNSWADTLSSFSEPSETKTPTLPSASASSSSSIPGSSVPEAITSPEVLVEFLSACFPECGVDYLQTKIRETFSTSTAHGLRVDPIEAIDIISNALYNDIETVENQQYQHQHQHQHQESGRHVSSPPLPPAAGKGASADLTSTSLADIQSKYAVPRPKGKNQRKKSSKGNGSTDSRRNGFAQSAYKAAEYNASDNAWGAINAELESICSIFPMLSIGTVRSTYHACGANIDQTVAKLSATVEKMAQTKPRAGAEAMRGKRAQAAAQPARKSTKHISEIASTLRMLFPDHDEDVLERIARESSDASDAADKVLRLPGETDRSSGKDGASANKGTKWRRADSLSSHRVSSSSGSALAGNGAEAHDPLERIPLADLSGGARAWVADHHVDPAYCRSKAEALLEKRNELYRKAVQAYARRSTAKAHSATALYYSTEGHKYDAKARVWRMRAAQATVAAMKRASENIIDLHGVSRAEAVAVVLEEANVWYSHTKSTDAHLQRPAPLHIITGLGTHSVDGKARVHPSVARALRENGWWFEEGRGFIDVLGVRQGGARV